MNNTKNERASSPRKPQASLLRSIVCGLLFTILIALILMCIVSYAIYRTDDPTSLVPYAGYALLAITSLLCGYISAKIYGRQWFVCGASAGLLFVLFCFAASLAMRERGTLPIYISVLIYLGMLLLSSLGGIIAGVKRRAPRRRTGR